MKRPLALVVVLGLLGLYATHARDAYASPPPIENVECMMGNITANTSLVGRLVGADATSRLTFTTHNDAIGESFTFSLDSGLTYDGMSIQLEGTGTYNSGTGQWEYQSLLTIGTEVYDGEGWGEITPGSPAAYEHDWVWTSTGGGSSKHDPAALYDQHSSTSVVTSGNLTLSETVSSWSLFGLTISKKTENDEVGRVRTGNAMETDGFAGPERWLRNNIARHN